MVPCFKARAGTGKTTTLIGALHHVIGVHSLSPLEDEKGKAVGPVEPSEQQQVRKINFALLV